MESWEILRDATEKVGVKALASRLKLSSALVYKWCQEPPSSEAPGCSGARNPLDRIRLIIEATRDPTIVNWLCNAGGGFFVPNPVVQPQHLQGQLIGATHRVVEEFGDLLSAVSRSIENDGQITGPESSVIRREWERLKMQAECFVVACERGLFRTVPVQAPAGTGPARAG